MSQAPQDSFLMLLIFLPFYLALAARSFEFRVAEGNLDVGTIKSFLSELRFPLRLLFNSERWYGFIFTVRIEPDNYFNSLLARKDNIMQGRLVLLVILGFIWLSSLLVVTRQTVLTNIIIALAASLLHLVVLYFSWNFGSKMKK